MTFILLMSVWMLLVGRAEPLGILVGVLLSAAIASSIEIPVRSLEVLRSIPRMLLAIAKAYLEAFQMFKRGLVGDYRVKTKELNTPWKTVIEVFEVTITPKTIVVDIEEDGLLEHVLSKSKGVDHGK
ncbi:MAG: Na+/H+ antiporter subunit E [Thermotogae bacterium]|nr:Na+/H+ antiporter subunit E [Thermotogota bacterium]